MTLSEVVISIKIRKDITHFSEMLGPQFECSQLARYAREIAGRDTLWAGLLFWLLLNTRWGGVLC